MPHPPARPPLITVRWESRHAVAVSKPAGMLSVPGKGPDKADCAIARIRTLYPHASCSITVHRLDMDTSGLLLGALTPRGQRLLALQFQRRTVTKAYTALVVGTPAAPAGTIELPLRPDLDHRPYQLVDHELGRPAITRYTTLDSLTHAGLRLTRLRLEPVTGRSHQLRVHCAHAQGLNCPILGDVLYAPAHPARRLMLHAHAIAFDDPSTRTRITLEDPATF